MTGISLLRKRAISSVTLCTLRPFNTSATLFDKAWRLAKGFPRMWTDRGILVEGPDFSYEDGRPTPYTSGQRRRIITQQHWAAEIVNGLNAVKFAQNRFQDQVKEKEEQNRSIINRKLKWKGGDFKGLAQDAYEKMRKQNPRKNKTEY